MELKAELEILADAAKYDASCASSSADKRGLFLSSGIVESSAPCF